MLLLITGDRNWENKALIKKWIIKIDPTWIIEGGARGADTLACEIAKELDIPIEEIKADWEAHHKAAGPIRNIQMLGYKPNLALAFHANIKESKGTKHMIGAALNEGVRVTLVVDTKFHITFFHPDEFCTFLNLK